GAVTLGASPTILSAFAQEDPSNSVPMEGGELLIHPVEHASLVLEAGDTVIYIDPVGEASAYADFPPPDLILITHEHGDHFNVETLNSLVAEETRMVTNPAVFEMLPENLQSIASQLANGESTEELGIGIEAIPAH